MVDKLLQMATSSYLNLKKLQQWSLAQETGKLADINNNLSPLLCLWIRL